MADNPMKAKLEDMHSNIKESWTRDTDKVEFSGLEDILSEEGVQIRLFGKPEVKGHRRFGVLLATDETIEKALEKVGGSEKIL